MNSIQRVGLHTLTCLGLAWFALFEAKPLHAGPNLIAIGNYSEVPYKRAEGRDSYNGKEVVFSFNEPEFDFGRVVVRSEQPLSVVRRDLFVGYTGQSLIVDSRGSDGGGSVRIDELEIWLKVRGRIQPEKSYEWEIETTGAQEVIPAFPAIIPALWADGQQIGVEVLIRNPFEENPEVAEQQHDDKIRRLEFPHGVVKIPSYSNPSGAAWVVLKPKDFGGAIGVIRFTLREIETDLEEGLKREMPVPVRYISIRSSLEDDIAATLERSSEALRRFQNDQYYWEFENPEYSVGMTSVAVAALSESKPDTENLDRAMLWLSKQEPPQNQKWQIETIAARLFTLSRYGGMDTFRGTINKDVQALTNAQLEDGGWVNMPANDGQNRAPGAADNPTNTTTENALSALRDARFAGAVIDAKVWRRSLQYWTDAQAFDGGFREKLERYGGVGQATTSAFTALGTASLIAAVDMASGLDSQRCNSYLANREQLRGVNNALAWLEKNYKEQFKDVGSFAGGVDPYLEAGCFLALGDASGISHFNDKRHFDETARDLLRHRDGSGLFGVRDGGGAWVQQPNPYRTAIALLILARGAAPSVCQRIIVGDDENRWREYSGDVTHLVRYLSQAREQQFNWRRTTIDREVRELVEVPITYVNIVGALNWTSNEWNKIRAYCMAGGTVVFNIDEGQESQRDVLTAGLKQTFPDYALAELPESHVIFKTDVKLEKRPKLQALGNGFRDFVFLPAESWSCRWNAFKDSEHDESLQFMNSLLTYATDSTPVRSSFVESTYASGSVPTKSMTVARVEVGGKVPAYPDLVENMDRLMRSNFRMGLKEAAENQPADMLWISVTGDAPISENAKSQISAALKDGRYLLVDVVSGNKNWDESFQAILKTLGSKVTLEKHRRSAPVYTGEVAGTQGFDVVDVALRKALHTRLSKRGRADLYSIRVDGKEVGVYSGHDLTSGIGFNYFPECRGPAPKDARGLVMNAFLDAYRHKVTRNGNG